MDIHEFINESLLVQSFSHQLLQLLFQQSRVWSLLQRKTLADEDVVLFFVKKRMLDVEVGPNNR